MGFLDRMISDLIQDNTGINARRLVRKIGGGKILAMGGAAIAASVMAEKHGMFGGQQTPAPGAPAPGIPPTGGAAGPPPTVPVGQTRPGQAASPGPPPPPPIPGSQPPPPQPVAPPPPPPVPGAAANPEVPAAPAEAAEATDSELPPELTYAIVRTMVAAALADGHMASEEKAMVQKHLGDSGLSEEQTSQIHKDLVLPPSPAELAALTDDQPGREMLYRFGALVVLADQRTSDLERGWLERLATAFEFDAEHKAELEAEIFSTEDT